MSSPPVAQTQATAQIGGIPIPSVDVPICSVFIALFLGLAAAHMTILQFNQRRKHKFLFSGMLFGFAMSRMVACAFRIAWAVHPTNVDVSLVASVFLNAGTLLVYIINLLFAWRMVRSALPTFGWNPIIRLINKIMLWAILGMLIPLIVVIVLRVKNPTLAGLGTAATVISRLAQTYFLGTGDEFGHGSWSHKIIILSVSIALATIEAGFRCGTAWTPTPLASNPAWWNAKAAFYCFNFVIDVLILGVMLAGRVDRRFHVPNKADGPGSYARDAVVGKEGGVEVGRAEGSK